MNEEEIIEILTDEDMYWNYPEKQVLEATRKLLDLYNQEKEKNKKLEEENKYLQDYLDGMEGGLKEQIKEQNKQIAELEEQLFQES